MADVVVETKDRIGRIELAGLDKKNALTAAMYQAMEKALREAEADPQVRVHLVHGARDCFTAGNDLNDFLARNASGGPSSAFGFISTLPTLEKPLVAAVGGTAVGVGTTMLMHCDFVYAAPNAKFQMPFVPLGLVPEAASSLLLPAIAGYQRAAELLMLGARSMRPRRTPRASSPRSCPRASCWSVRASSRWRWLRCRLPRCERSSA